MIEFDHDSLMELADQFDKKAEQLLETAESIRETALIMTAGRRPEDTPEPKPTPEPETKPTAEPQKTEPPLTPIMTHRSIPSPTTTNGPAISKTEPFNPPIIAPDLTAPKVPKRINGRTKMAPMEKLVLRALEGKPKGVEKQKIVTFCRRNGNVGTHNSITAALVKLKKAGYVVAVERGIYALANPLNKN